MNETVFKIRTVSDLRIAREHYRYEVKIQEEILGTRIRMLRTSFTDMLKSTVRSVGQQLLTMAIIKLIRSGTGRRSG
jgi:hypothetical protein